MRIVAVIALYADFVVYDDSMDILHVMAGGRKAVWDKEVIMKGTFEE